MASMRLRRSLNGSVGSLRDARISPEGSFGAQVLSNKGDQEWTISRLSPSS